MESQAIQTFGNIQNKMDRSFHTNDKLCSYLSATEVFDLHNIHQVHKVVVIKESSFLFIQLKQTLMKEFHFVLI